MTQCNLCLRNSRQLLGGDISSAERKQDIYHVYTYIQLYTQYMSNQCSIGFVVGMNDRPQNLVIWVVRPPAPARQTSAVADINAAGLSLATAHVKGCKAFWGRRNHHWVPSPIKKEEIMGFLPILNRYEMGCPSGKTCVYIYIYHSYIFGVKVIPVCEQRWKPFYPCLHPICLLVLMDVSPNTILNRYINMINNIYIWICIDNRLYVYIYVYII
jgi:hypothetical protein